MSAHADTTHSERGSMNKRETEATLGKVNAARTELIHLVRVGALAPSDPDVKRALGDVLLNLKDAAERLQAGAARNTKNYRTTIKHEGRPEGGMAYASADTAIMWARRAHEAGAVVAQVHRRSDGKVLFDGAAGIDLEPNEW